MSHKVTIVSRKLTVELTANGMFQHETYGSDQFLRKLFEKADAMDVLWYCYVYCDGVYIDNYHDIRSKFPLSSYVQKSIDVYNFAIKQYTEESAKKQAEKREYRSSQLDKIFEIMELFEELDDEHQKQCIKQIRAIYELH